MQTNNLLGQLAAATPVGSGDLLGIVVIVIRCVQSIAALVGVFALIMMCRSLMPTKHQHNLSDTDDNQNNSQDNQPKSKTLHLGSRLRLILCYNLQKPRHQRTLLSVARANIDKGVHLINKVLKFLFRGRVHKSKNVTMP